MIPGSCKLEKKDFPVHVVVTPKDVKGGLSKETVFMAEQLTTVDGKQILVKVGHILVESKVLTQLKEIMLRQLELGA